MESPQHINISNKFNIHHNVFLFGGYGMLLYTVALVVSFIINRPLFEDLMLSLVIAVPVVVGLGCLTLIGLCIARIHGMFAKGDLVHADENWVVIREGPIFNKHLVVQERNNTQHKFNYKINELPPQQDVPQLPPPKIQSFYDLLVSGAVRQALDQGKLILGYVLNQDGQATLRYGTWREVYSCAVAGVPGVGKTTTVLFLLYQAILCGAKLIVVDPHIHEPQESLAARLVGFEKSFIFSACDDTTSEVLKRIGWLKDEIKRRKKRGVKQPMVIAVFDEINALMRIDEVKKELTELLIVIEEEGRKYGMFALLIGQRWSRSDIGNPAVRGAVASMMVHRLTDANQIELLLGTKKHVHPVLGLDTGHHMFRDTKGGLSEIITPHTTGGDGEYIRWLLNGGTTGTGSESGSTGGSEDGSFYELPTGSDAWFNRPENQREPVYVDAEYRAEGSMQEEEEEVEVVDKSKLDHLIDMKLEGSSVNDIIAQVFGVTSKGAAYQLALQELRTYEKVLAQRYAKVTQR